MRRNETLVAIADLLAVIFLTQIMLVVSALEARAAAINTDAIREADRLFGYGADYAHERQALETLERALTNDPNDYQLLWRAARSYFYVGDGAPAKERLGYFERGNAVGQRAVAKNPDGVEGHFWLGACYGGYCREKGGITAFRNVKKVRVEMETVLRLNAGYEDGSAYHALGEIDRQLPRIFGGDLKRSITYLERGLSIAPGNLQIKCALAEAYLDANRKDDARRQLQELLQSTPSTTTSARSPENRKAQEKARKLLSKLS